jgi:hypothetical protein
MVSIASFPPVSLDAVLYVARAAFLVFSFAVAAIAFTRWRRSAERDTQHTADRLALVLARLEAIEARIAESEPRLTALGEQIETHFKSTAAASQHYPVAIRLARAGAQAEELVASCGLARQEAELVVRLHGRSSSEREREARHVALMRA